MTTNTTARKIRIAIADDHKLMRMGLVSLFNEQSDMCVVAEAADGGEAVRLAESAAPDVIIMDLMMVRVGGAEATRRILAKRPNAGVLILSSFANSADMVRAIRFGARGAQAKDVSTDDLLTAVRTIANGGTAIAPEIRRFVDETPLPPPLTQKQLEILNSITRGLSNQDIAQILGIAPESVKKHVSVILSKIGAATRAEATSIALRLGLLKM